VIVTVIIVLRAGGISAGVEVRVLEHPVHCGEDVNVVELTLGV